MQGYSTLAKWIGAPLQAARKDCDVDWPHILGLAGVPDQFLHAKHGPCPFCGGKDRYRFDDKWASGGYYCAQCGAGDGFTFLQRWKNWTFKEAQGFVDGLTQGTAPTPTTTNKTDYGRNKKRLADIKAALQNLEQANPVTAYLHRRGFDHKFIQSLKNIYYHPALPYWQKDPDTHKPVLLGKYPAMVALVCAGKPCTLHVTYLTQNGMKADVPDVRKTLPLACQATGPAVQLTAPDLEHPDCQLAIAEGIETALAVTALYHVPCWSALNRVWLEQWSPPEGITRIGVFSDNDATTCYDGQLAAYGLGRKLRKLGYTVQVHVPHRGDWNDVMLNR